MAKYRPEETRPEPPQRVTQRIDKWLWQARFFRTRSLATEIVAGGQCRINGVKILKPAHAVGRGDTLTLVQGHRVRVIRVLDAGVRRGPAGEAQKLYLDLDAPLKPPATPDALE